MSDWNPEQYEKFIEYRTLPAIDLVGRIRCENPAEILDVGCGVGNSTRALKNKFPDADIIGTDNSPEMLEKARRLNPGLRFEYLDANGDFESEKYDIVFSNACIQWIPNHAALLPKLMSALKPDGVLAVQIPEQEKHPVHAVLKKLSESEKWKHKVEKQNYNNLSAEKYYDILAEFSRDIDIWETVYFHQLPDCESIVEWYKGTGLRPYLDCLSESDAAEFTADVQAEIKAIYGTQRDGNILFAFPRLFFTARRNKF